MSQTTQAASNPTGEANKKFWDFIPGTETTPPEILLYGQIESQQSWWSDRVTPALFNQELAALGNVEEIVVRINSGGGDVFAANAIYTRLKDHSAHITVKIDGWAASAATIIAMAGDTIKIASNGVFMIHDPAMTVWDTYTENDFRKMADELKVIKQSIVNTYAAKTGKEPQEIEDLMEEETWWTGDAAVENGFCDELLFTETQTVVENSQKVVVNNVPINVSEFKTLPTAILKHPNNPGFLDNSATEKQHKEVGKMPENSITTVEALEAKYPDLVTSIKNAAKAEERNRIKAIKDIALDGFEQIAEDAMFEHPVTAEAVAMKIINEQKKTGGQYLTDRAADATDANTAQVGADATETGTGEKPDAIDAAIENLFSDQK